MVFGSMFDDYYSYKAQNYYLAGDSESALSFYQKVEKKSDITHYNIANILYHQKNYQEAIKEYEKITTKKILEKKWYNLANSYAKIDQFSKAIYYYEKVVQKSENQKAKENLEVVQEHIKQELLKLLKNEKSGFKGAGTEESIADEYEDLEIDEEKIVESNSSNIGNKNNISNLLGVNQKEQIYLKEIPENLLIKVLGKSKEKDFTTMQEQKWDELLKEKKTDSLIIPLNKKGVLDEDIKYPW
jgi:tetratricopeptide (TPR) repeat protein